MPNSFLLCCLGYIVTVLEDAKVYSEHAQKKELDEADIRLAVQMRMDHSFTSPPPRDVSAAIVGGIFPTYSMIGHTLLYLC